MTTPDDRFVARLRNRAIRGAGNWLAPGGAGGRLGILIYHRVVPAIDPLYPDEVDRAGFDWQMALLARGFNVLRLDEAVDRLWVGTLPPRAACVTFDDGYRDNHDVALPVLRKWNIPATFFIASGYLDGGCMWNDIIFESLRQAPGPRLDLAGLGLGTLRIASTDERRRAARALIAQLKYLAPEQRDEQVNRIVGTIGARVPDDLMMRPDHLRALCDAGMDIGAHTVSHPILARVSHVAAQKEIAYGRSALESIIARPVSLFAYPNGVPGTDYTAEHVQLVRDLGFKAAVSTAWGAATRTSERFELPRFTPWDMTPARFAARLLHNYLRVEPVVPGA